MLVAGNQVLWDRLGEPVTGTAVGVLSGLLLRLAAYRQGWRLPTGLDYPSLPGERPGSAS